VASGQLRLRRIGGWQNIVPMLNQRYGGGGVMIRCAALAVAFTLGLLAAPLAADAQPAPKIPRIGFLSVGAAARQDAFVQRLRELGHIDKQNVVIEYRFGEGRHDLMDALARELVNLNVDVIMAFGDEAIVAAKKTTATIPIVMFACDALTVGFVASLARPGGNVTGVTCVTTELSPKRVALLREAVPGVARIGILFNPANVSKPLEADRTRTVAQGMGLKVQTQEVLERADIERAFSAFAQQRADAVLVLDEAFIFIHSKLIAELAVRHRLPTVYTWRQSVVAGGLMSYGPSAVEMLQVAVTYVDKILRGAKPGDLPVEQPIKFELHINEKTAKSLGLTIPSSLLLRADEVMR
jgi:putative ABC transport system substrate-binding protein